MTAVCLHNMLVDAMIVNYKDTKGGKGAPLNNDGIYLDGHRLGLILDGSVFYGAVT